MAMQKIRLRTSESVTEGHPDKICDQISDAILDAILANDPDGRAACEVTATTGQVNILGELSTNTYVDIKKIVSSVIKDIGYVNPELGFDYSCAVNICIDEQSPDISQSVTKAKDNSGDVEGSTGAGDQGIMFGFACDETEELMPMAISLAHKLTRQLANARKSGKISYLRPDGKAQVTVKYVDDIPVAVDTIIVSTQHDDFVDNDRIKKDILKEVIFKAIPQNLIDEQTKILINPSGRFVIGGPQGDTGLTGRKIIVDTYGGYCPHGGGAMSGKDPTKVDRSAAYMARYVCKNIVAAGLAKRVLLEVAYAIGYAQPVSLHIDTFSTGVLSDQELTELIKEVFDFRPYAIIRQLDLKKPIYTQTAKNGHFGNKDFSWEKTDRVEQLKAEAAKRKN